MVLKKGVTHQRVIHLSRLINGEEPTSVPHILCYVYLVNVKMVPKWIKDIVPMLTMDILHLSTSKDANFAFIENSWHYSIIANCIEVFTTKF